MKPLPDNLRYTFLRESSTLSIILSLALSPKQDENLFDVLRDHKLALGRTIPDIQGISHLSAHTRSFLKKGQKLL